MARKKEKTSRLVVVERLVGARVAARHERKDAAVMAVALPRRALWVAHQLPLCHLRAASLCPF